MIFIPINSAVSKYPFAQVVMETATKRLPDDTAFVLKDNPSALELLMSRLGEFFQIKNYKTLKVQCVWSQVIFVGSKMTHVKNTDARGKFIGWEITGDKSEIVHFKMKYW